MTKSIEHHTDVAVLEEVQRLAEERTAQAVGRVQAQLDQERERAKKIAECHEAIGRIQAAQVFSEFGNVTSLVWLKDVKDSKVYKDLPGIGTWDKFCERLGISRDKADLDLRNLATFGERFLGTVHGLKVGYRDLKKLRQLTHEGTLTVEAEAVTIGEETIPLTPEHTDDLRAALERVLEAKDALLQEKDATLRAKDKVLEAKEQLLQRQARDLARLERAAEVKGLTAEEAAFSKTLDELRTVFDGVMAGLDPARAAHLATDAATPQMTAAYLSTLDYLRKRTIAAHNAAVSAYGDPDTCPEDAWTPPPLEALRGGHR